MTEHDFIQQLARNSAKGPKARLTFLALGIAGFFFPGLTFVLVAKATARALRSLEVTPTEVNKLVDFLAFGGQND